MLDAILSFAIRQRWLVMIGVLVMGAFGAWNFMRLPIDAVPDITNVQIQINSRAPGYSPLEVEQRITFPVETAMGGLPRLDSTRSQSRYGLSQVTVIFKHGTDIYFARQLSTNGSSRSKTSFLPVSKPRWGRSPRVWAKSICSRSKQSRRPATRAANLTLPAICVRSRTGLSSRNCGTFPASSR